MPTTVYLIGVDHTIQYINESASPAKYEQVHKFSHHLTKVAKEHQATLIAEEFSKEALDASKATTSTAQKVASEVNIRHRFCDPSTEQRRQSGIAKNDVWSRERYWLDCIRANQDGTIIFICGDNHVKNFESLLWDEGYKVDIVSTGWGNDIA
jgi:hypothetical protein